MPAPGLTDNAFADPHRESRIILELQDSVAGPRPAAHFVKRQRRVDELQVISQLIGIAWEQHTIVVWHFAGHDAVNVPGDIRRAVVAERVVNLRMIMELADAL